MDGADHVGFAVGCQIVAAHLTGLSPAETAASLILAAGTSAGRGSPDMDNFKLWRKTDGALPDEELGHQGPLRHRGITHWWAWPALAAWVAVAADLGSAGWVVWALILGWSSHLVGDFIYGEQPPGIPVMPWWAHVGLRFDSGGWFEWFAVRAFLLGVVWWLTGWAGHEQIAALRG